MTQTKHDPTITIVPPICAAKGERHPQWVALTMPVELAHCEGDIEEISEADSDKNEGPCSPLRQGFSSVGS